MATIHEILQDKGGEVHCVTPDTTVLRTIELMAYHDIGAVVVRSSGRPIGMFDERDYARKVVLRGQSSSDVRIADVMRIDVPCVDIEQSVEDCMSVMTEHRVRHVPVLEGDVLIGVLSIGDLVKALIDEREQTIGYLQDYITWSR